MSRIGILPSWSPNLVREMVDLPGFGKVNVAHACPRQRGKNLPVLVVLPGLRGSDQGLGRVLAPLCSGGVKHEENCLEKDKKPRLDDLEIFVINPPGIGISPANFGINYDFHNQVRLVKAFLEYLCRPVVLVGHSYGSIVASALGAEWSSNTATSNSSGSNCQDYCETSAGHLQKADTQKALTSEKTQLKALILLSPIPLSLGSAIFSGNNTGHNFVDRIAYLTIDLYCRLLDFMDANGFTRFFAQAVIDRDSRGVLSNFVLTRFGWRSWRRVAAASREKQLYHADLRAVAATHRASLRFDCSQFASRISLPTVIIAGDKDHLAKKEELNDLRNLLRQRGALRLTAWVKGGGHLLHHEVPTQISALIDRFLRNLFRLDSD